MDLKSRSDICILRFAHAFSSGGGMETYIHDLDRTLLANNNWTIIRMYLLKETKINSGLEYEKLGKGLLVKVPVNIKAVNKAKHDITTVKSHKLTDLVLNTFRDYIIYNPILYRIVFRGIIERKPIPERPNEAPTAGDVAKELLEKFKVNLLVMHYASGRDSAGIIQEAVSKGIPYIFINHFANDSLSSISVREQTARAAGIGGVAGVGVPRRLRKFFVNISDGIDIQFFRREKAVTKGDWPILFLPARITPTKGQHDLVAACGDLRKEGVRVKIALAGRPDEEGYTVYLRELAAKNGIGGDLLLLGQLDANELKYWYEKSSLMVFPTYHHEGLPRILLESQAMEVPPISYIVGGTPDAIINGATGYLVKKGDIKSLKRRMVELLTNDTLRLEMGRAGRALVEEKFSLSALAQRHKAFYLLAIKK